MPVAQLTSPATTGVALFYNTDPGELPNPAASFFASFLQARAPDARALYNARLAAYNPATKMKVLADLAAERGRRLDAMDKNAQTLERASAARDVGWMDLIKQGVALEGINVEAGAKIATAKIEQQTARERMGELSDTGRQVLNRAMGDLAGAESGILNGDAETGAKLQRAMELRVAEAGDLQPGEVAEIGRRLNQAVVQSPIRNEQARAGVMGIVGEAFNAAEPAAAQSFGVRTRGFGDVLGDVVEGAGAAELPMRSGSSSVTTTTRTPTRVGQASALLSPGRPVEPPAPGATVTSPAARSTGGVPPSPASSAMPSTPRTLGASSPEDVRYIDELIKRLSDQQPNAELGGFADPLPGLGYPPGDPRRRGARAVTYEMDAGERARVRRDNRAAGADPVTGRRPGEPETELERSVRLAQIGKGGGVTHVTEIPTPPATTATTLAAPARSSTASSTRPTPATTATPPANGSEAEVQRYLRDRDQRWAWSDTSPIPLLQEQLKVDDKRDEAKRRAMEILGFLSERDQAFADEAPPTRSPASTSSEAGTASSSAAPEDAFAAQARAYEDAQRQTIDDQTRKLDAETEEERRRRRARELLQAASGG